MAEAIAHVASLRLTGRALITALLLAIANWIFDIACLASAIKAVGLPVRLVRVPARHAVEQRSRPNGVVPSSQRRRTGLGAWSARLTSSLTRGAK